jgi:hypothetical protein
MIPLFLERCVLHAYYREFMLITEKEYRQDTGSDNKIKLTFQIRGVGDPSKSQCMRKHSSSDLAGNSGAWRSSSPRIQKQVIYLKLIPVEAQSTQIYVQIYIQMSKFMAFTLS